MKLHLGCGKRYLEGFIHIDIEDFEHIDYKSSINDLNMINDESCDLIYASHVLEYFNKKDIKEIKKYAAVLKTPMHEVFFKDQNNKEFLKKEIIEDIKLVIFGE